MSVKVSGPVISSLFFEHNNADNDVEGFLLGQIHSHVTSIVTDTQMNGIKEETVTYIHAFVPCSGLFNWYKSSGEIITAKLKHILKDKKHKEVVGWYKFRRNTPDTVSLREQRIHQHLLAAFPGIVADNFLFLLCNASQSSNMSTHSFDHTFLSYNGRSFRGVPLSIINLGDAPQSLYRHQPSNAINSQKGMFAATVKSFQDQFCDQQGKMHSVTGVQTFNSVIHQQLMDLCSTVAVSEKQLGDIQADIVDLEKRLQRKHQSRVSHQLRRQQLGEVKDRPPPPLPTSSPPRTPSPEPGNDLIVLDDSHEEEQKDVKPKTRATAAANNKAPVEVRQVPILNPQRAEKAPIKSKMAANLGNVDQVKPQKSNLEPSVSKSVSKSASVEEKDDLRKTKKSDSFSFVDDLLTEHKTLLRSDSKRGNKSMKTVHSLEEKTKPRKEPAEISKSVQEKETRSKVTRSRKTSSESPPRPATAFNNTDDGMEFETSDSPTF